MKSIKNVVIFTTIYFCLYVTLVSIPQVPFHIVLGLFSISPFLIIYLVFRVLTGGSDSGHTFQEQFYEDRNDIRRAQ